MKKIIPILLILFSFLIINVSSVLACSMTPSYIQLNEGENKCFIYPDYNYRELNITSLDESNIDTVCPDLSLTDSDKNIILETLDQYKSDYGYTYIEKQTDEEFNEFQK